MPLPLLDQALIWSGDGVTAANVAYFPDCARGQYIEFIVYIKWSSGTSAGKIQVQTADTKDYAGTWANVGSTIDWAAASSTKYGAVTGVFGALRLYIDTTVVGGTVTPYVVAGAL